ncbi:Molybdenum cofactor sulfurase [Phytophthora cinnamomi]|uniref:Molybdenum cofactor sulfurase n=1 Tax=Phytophthora cinnamomi TaxID=4785 RepID=UPI003559B97C|nr:Molybdenum cofactor sulfurase [Phytophthora cinnamomi]
MPIGAATPTNMAYLRLGLRGLQFLCSLLAMAFAAAGFYSGGATHSSTFVLLMGYTGMLYTLWYVVAVEVLHLANRPALRLEQATDAALALALLVAGICLAASDYTKNCGYGWHCHNLRAATAFDFISMFLFLVSLGLTFVAATGASQGLAGEVQVEEPVPYHQSATPTSGALSPIGNLADGPASKV